MNRFACAIAALALGALVGCNTSPSGGGAGSAGTRRSNQVTVTAPTLSTDLKHGETKTVKLSLNKGSDFKEDVELKFDAPPGIKVDPTTTTVHASEKGDNIELKVTAANDAPVGDHTVKVTATPKVGTPTNVDFKVTVKENK
jgi:uncharacterized membrane protein